MRTLLALTIAVAVLVSIGSPGEADATSGDEAAAAVPASAHNWTGLYAGANIGYGWGWEAIRVSGDAGSTEAALRAGVLPRSLADGPDGIIGGGQVGYNFQISRWVLGIETDLQGADISERESVSTAVPGFFPYVTKASQTLDLLGTVRGRVGYAVTDPLLLYVTSGFAYGHVALSASALNPGCAGVCTDGSTSALNAGWTIGAGLEYAFGRRWSLRAEYLYYDLGNRSTRLTDILGRSPGVFQTYSADFSSGIVRFGLNYRVFGP